MPNLTKPEPLVKTSAGLETASQTVERVKANRYGTPPSTPPAGSVASISPYAVPDYLTEAEKAQSNLLRINEGDANQKVNSNQEYRNALKQYQQQIDATNAVYADQLNQSRLAGQGRLGSNRAGQARGGLLGSDFGSAQTNDVTSANQQADQSIQNAQQVALQTIYGLARADANANMAAKVAAKKAGAEALVKYYTETVPTQRTAKISKVAQALFDKNIDPTTLSSQEKAQLSEGWGVSYDDIQSNYNALKTANEEAQAKQAREIAKEQSAMDKTTADIAKINADIESGKLITIGEGTMLYNTETGETMKNPKTYAPSSGGAGGLTPYQQFQATQAIAKDTQARTANAREMTRQAQLIQNSFDNIKKGGDQSLNTQAIIVSFNKILDPTSVVRESEYDRTAQGQSLLNQLEGKLQNITTGGAGVTTATLEEAKNIANQYLEGAKKSIEEQNQRAIDMANQFGLNPNFVGAVGTVGAGQEQASPVAAQVEAAGLDYQAMVADGLTDEQILQALNGQ